MHAGSIGSRSLFGRAAEVRALRGHVAAAVAGEGSCLLIAGPPGIGKSRLLEEAAALAREAGASVHRARCWEEGGAPPFWPWMQIARSIGADASLPFTTPGSGGKSAMDSAEGRFALFTTFTDGLRRQSKASARLILIDDLHAADPGSVVMTEFVASEIREARILVIGAYRDTEVAADPEQAARFAKLEREASTIHVRGLDEEAIAQWTEQRLGAVPRGDLLAAMVTRTEGNPLFVDGILRSIAARGGLLGARNIDDLEALLTLPTEIGAAVRSWIGRLSPQTRGFLQAASAIGIEFETEILSAIASVERERLAAAIAEATDLAVLAPDSPTAATRRFSHALIQEALFRSLGETERRSLDHRIADELRRRADDDEVAVSRIAHHLIRSVDAQSAALTMQYALRAAAVAERRHADGDAARFLQHGLETGQRFALLDANRRAELLLQLGQQRFQGGDRAGAREALRDAFELGRSIGRVDIFTRAAIDFVGPTAPIDDHEESRLLVSQAVEVLPERATQERARILLALADTRRYENPDPVTFLSALRTAKAISKSTGDTDLQLRVLLRELQSLIWTDDIEQEERLVQEAQQFLVADSDEPVQILVRSLLLRSFLERGLVHEKERVFNEIQCSAKQSKRPFSLFVAAAHRMMEELNAGNFEATFRSVDSVNVMGRFLDPMAERMVATQSFLTGREVDDARRLNVGAAMLIQQHDGMRQIPNSVLVPLIVSWHIDDPKDAREQLRAAAASGFSGLVADRTQGPIIADILSEICLEANDDVGAAALEPWLRRWAGRLTVTSDLAFHCFGSGSSYLGLALAVLERWEEAEASLLDAIDRNQSIGAPLWAEHARCNLAWMLARRGTPGDHPRAEALLASVRSWAEPRGAKRLLRRAEAAEQLLRPTPAPPPAAGLESPEIRFQREGQFWTIGDERRSIRVRDSKGLRYLETLIRHPGRSFWVTDLVSMIVNNGDRVDRVGAIDPSELPHRPLGHAGEVLDAKAIQSLRLRAKDIRQEIDEAGRSNDRERALRLREELEFIEHELRGGVGRGGRARRAADVQERIRKAVTNRIRDAIQLIRKELPDLGDHLDRCVKTGAQCSYEATSPKRWRL
jgi:hypothetical protein